MTKEDIIRMARDAEGDHVQQGLWAMRIEDLERFAALVVAAEREACAKVCDDMVLYTGYDCAAAIRARGQA